MRYGNVLVFLLWTALESCLFASVIIRSNAFGVSQFVVVCGFRGTRNAFGTFTVSCFDLKYDMLF